MNGQDFLMRAQGFTGLILDAAEALAVATEERLHAARPQIMAIDDDNASISDDTYQHDLALLRAAPVAVIPKHGEFHPLMKNGHRFLLAADGLHLEVRRPWLYFVHPLAQQGAVAMPYGRTEPRIDLAFGRLSNAMALIRKFAAAARREAPNEWADMLVWNGNELTDLNVSILEHSPGAVRYQCRDLEDHENIAIDLHSHGHLPAFFSGTDDTDDAGSVKIAGVIGDLDKPEPTAAFRLCVLGLYLPIAVPAVRIFGEDKA